MATEPSSELWRRIERAGTAIDPGLSERDVERLVAGARRLGRRQAAARRAFAGAALVLLAGVAGAGVWWKTRPTTSEPPAQTRTGQLAGPSLAKAAPGSAPPVSAAPPPSGRAAARAVRLQDGSVAIPMDDGTELTLRESSERRVAIDLERGRGRFEVTPRSGRTFTVRAGEVSVTVLGTIFTVERVADRIGVGVERGRVLVDWGTGATRLGAGERGWFPPPPVDARSAPPPATAAVDPGVLAGATARPAIVSRANGTTEDSDRRPARAARSLAAAPLPIAPVDATPRAAEPAAEPASGPAAEVVAGSESTRAVDSALPSGETMEALLAAADGARLQGRTTDATAFLQRAVTLHPGDGRAPLAAFTLGRLLLVKLGQPREAAEAFAQARGLAPDGPLAEDALAREVEAWAGASDRAHAHDRAAEYLRRYPSGRRLRTVRVFGGLE